MVLTTTIVSVDRITNLFSFFEKIYFLASLLDDLDPLSSKKPQAKTPQSFLGENSALVNLDNLIKPAVPSLGQQPQSAYNPFGDMPQQRTNLFQQQTQPVSLDYII